jgi:hypothetical protein
VGAATGEVLGGVLTVTGLSAALGVPTLAVSTALVVGGAGNVIAGVRGLMTTGSGSGAGKAKVTVSQSRSPETAAHIKDAQQAGDVSYQATVARLAAREATLHGP